MGKRWQGPIGFEGVTTGDNRYIDQGALRWDTLPVPLRYASADIGAHDGAQVVGHIDTMDRLELGEANDRLAQLGREPLKLEGDVKVIWGGGDFDEDGVVGLEALRHVEKALTNGISMDLDDVSWEVRGVQLANDADSDVEIMATMGARIRAATIVAIPAFEGARIAMALQESGEESGLPLMPNLEAEDGDEVIIDSNAAEDNAESGQQQDSSSGADSDSGQDSGIDDADVQSLKDAIDQLFQGMLAKKQAAALQRRVELARAGKSFASVPAEEIDGSWYEQPGADPVAKPADLAEDLVEILDELTERINDVNESSSGTLTADDVLDYLTNDFYGQTYERVPLKQAWNNMLSDAANATTALGTGDSEAIRNAGVLLKNGVKNVEDAFWNVWFSDDEALSDDERAFHSAFKQAYDETSDELHGLLGDLHGAGHYMIELGSTAEAVETAKSQLQGIFEGGDAAAAVASALSSLDEGGAHDIDTAIIELHSAAEAADTTNAQREQVNRVITMLEPHCAAGSLWEALEKAHGKAEIVVEKVYVEDENEHIGAPVITATPVSSVEYYPEEVAAPVWGAQTEVFHRANWVEKAGGLPPYIKFLADHIRASNPSWSQSRAIAVAVNVAKRWSRGGTTTGKAKAPHVGAATVAKSASAVADWEAKKAASHAGHIGKHAATTTWASALTEAQQTQMFLVAAKAAAVALGWEPAQHTVHVGFTKLGWTIQANVGDGKSLPTWDIVNADGKTVDNVPDFTTAAVQASGMIMDAKAKADAKAAADSGAESGAESGAAESGKAESGAESGKEDSGAPVDSGAPESGKAEDSGKKVVAKAAAETVDVYGTNEQPLPAYEPEQRALVASGAQLAERTLAAPIAPPKAWFDNPRFSELSPITVMADGRVFGHLASWNQCHLAMPNGVNECVVAPHSQSGYSLFHLGYVTTAEGTDVGVGRITMNTSHAGDAFNARRAVAHYENTGMAIADVHAGEDSYGIWIAGALRPDATPEQIRALKASPLSGDWRRGASGGLELVMALAVNQPGFPVPRPKGLVASGALQSMMAVGLVAPKKVVAPGKPGALSIEDLRYLKRGAQRERDAQGAELAARATAAINRAKVTAFAHQRASAQRKGK